MAKKPTGDLGYTRIILQAGGDAEMAFHPVHFPEDKEGIEVQVVDAFMRDMARQHAEEGKTWSLTQPRQNAQNHYDFTVRLPDDTDAWLELTEWAPLAKSSYANATWTYNVYDVAKALVGKIMKKAGHYGEPKPDTPQLYLLIYITHGAFAPSDSMLNVVRAFLARETHPFAAVYFHHSISPGFGVGQILAPVDAEFIRTFDPELYRDRVVHNVNPAKTVFEVGEGSV